MAVITAGRLKRFTDRTEAWGVAVVFERARQLGGGAYLLTTSTGQNFHVQIIDCSGDPMTPADPELTDEQRHALWRDRLARVAYEAYGGKLPEMERHYQIWANRWREVAEAVVREESAMRDDPMFWQEY